MPNHSPYIITLCLVISLTLVTASYAAETRVPGNPSPVTFECLKTSSEKFSVPLALLIGILATEGGRIGHISHNTNGSYDMGPMQINSWWLPKLNAINIQEEAIIQNGCVNTAAAAWLLRSLLIQYPDNLDSAIGHYHSPNATRARNYAHIVRQRLPGLNVSRILKNTNSPLVN